MARSEFIEVRRSVLNDCIDEANKLKKGLYESVMKGRAQFIVESLYGQIATADRHTQAEQAIEEGAGECKGRWASDT